MKAVLDRRERIGNEGKEEGEREREKPEIERRADEDTIRRRNSRALENVNGEKCNGPTTDGIRERVTRAGPRTTIRAYPSPSLRVGERRPL